MTGPAEVDRIAGSDPLIEPSRAPADRMQAMVFAVDGETAEMVREAEDLVAFIVAGSTR